jgi:hypothetical protein
MTTEPLRIVAIADHRLALLYDLKPQLAASTATAANLLSVLVAEPAARN